MNEEVKYWKWKSTIIDFNAISDEPLDYAFHPKKKEWIFRYLGIPDNDIHEWYNGGFSSEYNSALKYAEELGLIEDYIDYDDVVYDLKSQIEEKDRIITNAINFIYKNTNKTMSEEEFMLELLEVLSKEKSDK